MFMSRRKVAQPERRAIPPGFAFAKDSDELTIIRDALIARSKVVILPFATPEKLPDINDPRSHLGDYTRNEIFVTSLERTPDGVLWHEALKGFGAIRNLKVDAIGASEKLSWVIRDSLDHGLEVYLIPEDDAIRMFALYYHEFDTY